MTSRKNLILMSCLRKNRTITRPWGGFVTSLFGYIPKKGETVEWDDFTFEISRLDKYRVDKIICTQKEEQPQPESED
ncbi:transporter associated domain-containing protein [Anaerovibrio lipolyticus]|uniref:transporter associated domain-containing protein n=1 Tax=Anaerovibrio lipolyticus TaxID=82374 RepID=UPI002E110CB7